jgi:hypothetical protein
VSRRPHLIHVLLFTFLFPRPAGAQIVNIERLLAGEPRPGLSGALQAGFGLKQGNSESAAVDGSGLLRWMGGRHLIQVVAAGAWEKAQGRRVADHAMGHLRYGYRLRPGLTLEALYQLQRDAFVRLRRRVLAGAGVRTILRADGPRLETGLILMYEQEKLRDDTSVPGWRGSLLLSVGWSLSPTATLGSQLYWQPRPSDPADFRVLYDLGIGVQLLARLSLRLDARLVHDGRPPAGVKRTDLSIRNALAIAF